MRHVHQRLDVVHDRGLAEQPRLNGEGRLVPWLAAQSLDRVEERGLFPADVSAGAAPDLDVESDASAENVLTEQTRRACLRECLLDTRGGERILAANVEVAQLTARREAGDRHRLDERERILFHENAILERSRLGLVGVAHEVVRSRRLLRHCLPLASSRERRAATPQQLRRCDFGDHALGADLECLPECLIAARRAVCGEARRVDVADTLREECVLRVVILSAPRARRIG